MKKIEYIYKEEIVKELSKILVENNILDKACDESTVGKYIRSAVSAINEASGLNVQFHIGNGLKKGKMFFSRSYAKLLFSFIALKQEFQTFEIITRSDDNEYIHKSSKEKFSQSRTLENMSYYSPEEYLRFKNRFDFFYTEYITPQERRVLKKHLKESNINITVEKFDNIRNLMNEVAVYVDSVLGNYTDSAMESTELVIKKIKDENTILSAKTSENGKMGNFYDKIYRAIAQSIKTIYSNEVNAFEEDTKPEEIKKASKLSLNEFIADKIQEIDDKYNDFYIPKDYLVTLCMESGKEAFQLTTNSKSFIENGFYTIITYFVQLIMIRFDIEGIQHLGAEVVGIDFLSGFDDVKKRYILDNPMSLLTAYTYFYKELVRFDDNIRVDLDIMKYVDGVLEHISDSFNAIVPDSEHYDECRKTYISCKYKEFTELLNLCIYKIEPEEKNSNLFKSLFDNNKEITKLFSDTQQREFKDIPKK